MVACLHEWHAGHGFLVVLEPVTEPLVETSSRLLDPQGRHWKPGSLPRFWHPGPAMGDPVEDGRSGTRARLLPLGPIHGPYGPNPSRHRAALFAAC